MKHNPDIYLLYEYMDKVPFTVRMKVVLDASVDAALLMEAVQEAIGRFPYFSVKVGLDEGQNYTLEHNGKPVAVLRTAGAGGCSIQRIRALYTLYAENTAALTSGT